MRVRWTREGGRVKWTPIAALCKIRGVNALKLAVAVWCIVSAASCTKDPLAIYKKDCDKGVARACHDLGVLNEEGQGTPKNLAAAKVAYRRGCEGGYGDACNNLGLIHADAGDDPGAAGWYEKGCAAKSIVACNTLATVLQRGRGIAQDQKRAAALYTESCEQGFATACTNIGAVYADGEAVEKDEARAVKLYERACEGGDRDGCYNLAFMHGQGFGVPKDEEKSIPLLEKSCKLGLAKACDTLQRLRAARGK